MIGEKFCRIADAGEGVERERHDRRDEHCPHLEQVRSRVDPPPTVGRFPGKHAHSPLILSRALSARRRRSAVASSAGKPGMDESDVLDAVLSVTV